MLVLRSFLGPIWLRSKSLLIRRLTVLITEVYFIRHGIAIAREAGKDDEQRQLTEKGVTKTKRIAQRLGDLGLQFDTMLTSPLVRAQQTADILNQAGLASHVEEFLPLRPDGKLSDWLTWLGRWQSASASPPAVPSVALVGHEPNLSEWAQHLVCGEPQSNWTLKKAGIIGLRLPQAQQAIGQSQLFWLAPPRLLLR